MNPGYTKLAVETERRGDHSMVRVTGDLDHDSAPGLRQQLEQATGDEVCHIDLDLAAVTFIDSAALQVFVAVTDELRSRGGALRVTQASPVVARILEVTRLTELFAQ